MSAATTSPATMTHLSGETLAWSIDLSPLLAAGVTLSGSPTAALYDITSADPGTSFPNGLSGAASISGTSVVQKVTGLTAGHTYRLVLGATASDGSIWQAGLILVCSF